MTPRCCVHLEGSEGRCVWFRWLPQHHAILIIDLLVDIPLLLGDEIFVAGFAAWFCEGWVCGRGDGGCLVSGSTMLRTGGRGLSQLLRRAVASAPPAAHGGQSRVLAAAASTAPSPSRFNAVSWFQQQAGITIPAGDEADSHDDFKPVQKQGSSVPSAHEAIEKDVKENPVLVYMKGVPEAPQCGFSAMVVRILDAYEVDFQSRNVLADPELRTAIKDYSKWPTIPQVYVNGEFLGGSDILISMHRSGELETLLKDMKKVES